MKVRNSARTTLTKIADRLAHAVELSDSFGREVVGDGDSSIVARLEGLLQVVCAEPKAIHADWAWPLSCNAATAKKVV